MLGAATAVRGSMAGGAERNHQYEVDVLVGEDFDEEILAKVRIVQANVKKLVDNNAK